MKFLLLLVTIGSALLPAATLTFDLTVRENYTPSRHATLSVTDGSSAVTLDLYRTLLPGEIPQLGYCRNFGNPPPACRFTPGGNLTADDIGAAREPITMVIDGIAVSYTDRPDYAISFSANFTGGSLTTVSVGSPWGPYKLNADLSITVVQLSSGICVFCAHAPYGAGTASGSSVYRVSYPDYRFHYQASGEIVPEPGSLGLGLIGMAVLVLGLMRDHRHQGANQVRIRA